MTTTPGIAAALAQLVSVARGMTDLGPMEHLTCSEAEALADVIRAVGEPELAGMLIEAHRTGDDENDPHDPQFDERPVPAPLRFVLVERVNGMAHASTRIEGVDHPAREVYIADAIVFEYRDDDGNWIEFDRHPA